MNAMKISTAVVLAALPVIVAAQAKPNFSGTWNCDEKRSTNCLSAAIVIKHTGDTLAVNRAEAKAVVQTFRLDGTETTNDPAQETGFRGGKLPQSKATARWDGNAVVVETRSLEEKPRIGKSVWRLSPDGNELVIEGTRPDGVATKIVYTKAGL
jgi:hypothetical protein